MTTRDRPDPDEYLGLTRLARVSGLSVRTLRARIHDATDPLPAYQVGRRKLLVRRDEFARWMARRRYTARTVDTIVDEVLRELTPRHGRAPGHLADAAEK